MNLLCYLSNIFNKHIYTKIISTQEYDVYLLHHILAFQLTALRVNNKMGCFEKLNNSKSGNLPNIILIKLCENTSKLCKNTLLYNSDKPQPFT